LQDAGIWIAIAMPPHWLMISARRTITGDASHVHSATVSYSAAAVLVATEPMRPSVAAATRPILDVGAGAGVLRHPAGIRGSGLADVRCWRYRRGHALCAGLSLLLAFPVAVVAAAVQLPCRAVRSGQIGKLRRRVIGGCAAFGAFAGTLVYAVMLMHPEWMTIAVRHTPSSTTLPSLAQPHPHTVTPVTLYGLTILVPLLFSSHRRIRVFGVLVILSMALASAAYNKAFVSVWCFFAAVLSLYLVQMIRRVAAEPRVVAESGPGNAGVET